MTNQTQNSLITVGVDCEISLLKRDIMMALSTLDVESPGPEQDYLESAFRRVSKLLKLREHEKMEIEQYNVHFGDMVWSCSCDECGCQRSESVRHAIKTWGDCDTCDQCANHPESDVWNEN